MAYVLSFQVSYGFLSSYKTAVKAGSPSSKSIYLIDQVTEPIRRLHYRLRTEAVYL
jgi:hypothetical protein